LFYSKLLLWLEHNKDINNDQTSELCAVLVSTFTYIKYGHGDLLIQRVDQ